MGAGASGSDVYQPTMWYYDMLLFLKELEMPRQAETSVCEASGKKANILK